MILRIIRKILQRYYFFLFTKQKGKNLSYFYKSRGISAGVFFVFN